MFDLSLGEMAVIGLLVLVLFDADQIPGLMRQAGKLYAKVRGASDDLRRAFNAEVARAETDQRRAELDRRREEINVLREAKRQPRPEPPPDLASDQAPAAAPQQARALPTRPDPASYSRPLVDDPVMRPRQSDDSSGDA